MKLIDLENIDFVILEDSLHRIEHKKGDEVDCVIGANEVKAIPIETMEQILSEIQSLRGCSCGCSDGIIDDVEDIIDKALKEQNA